MGNQPGHIAVLFHENDRHRDLSTYIVGHLAPFWREDGHQVTFLFGTRHFVPADILFVHVNLSVVPDRYVEFAARYPVAVNSRIRDIRKSVISRNLVGPGDPWDGPVIVKTPDSFLVIPGVEASFTVTVSNLGGGDARNVYISDSLPSPTQGGLQPLAWSTRMVVRRRSPSDRCSTGSHRAASSTSTGSTRWKPPSRRSTPTSTTPSS